MNVPPRPRVTLVSRSRGTSTLIPSASAHPCTNGVRRALPLPVPAAALAALAALGRCAQFFEKGAGHLADQLPQRLRRLGFVGGGGVPLDQSVCDGDGGRLTVARWLDPE